MSVPFVARFLVSLVGVASLSTPADSAVKDPQVIVEMRNLQRPEYAPLPAYPKEARQHHWGGLAIYEIHSKFSGEVAYVFVRLSTGHPILDEAGKAALAQWRWHGGRYRLLPVFMTFDPGTVPPPPSRAASR